MPCNGALPTIQKTKRFFSSYVNLLVLFKDIIDICLTTPMKHINKKTLTILTLMRLM